MGNFLLSLATVFFFYLTNLSTTDELSDGILDASLSFVKLNGSANNFDYGASDAFMSLVSFEETRRRSIETSATLPSLKAIYAASQDVM